MKIALVILLLKYDLIIPDFLSFVKYRKSWYKMPKAIALLILLSETLRLNLHYHIFGEFSSSLIRTSSSGSMILDITDLFFGVNTKRGRDDMVNPTELFYLIRQYLSRCHHTVDNYRSRGVSSLPTS